MTVIIYIIDNHHCFWFRSFPFVLGLRKSQKIQLMLCLSISKSIHGNWRVNQRYTIEHLCILNLRLLMKWKWIIILGTPKMFFFFLFMKWKWIIILGTPNSIWLNGTQRIQRNRSESVQQEEQETLRKQEQDTLRWRYSKVSYQRNNFHLCSVYFSWVSILKGPLRSGVIILSVHLKGQRVKIVMETQKAAAAGASSRTSPDRDVNTHCKTYFSYERTSC